MAPRTCTWSNSRPLWSSPCRCCAPTLVARRPAARHVGARWRTWANVAPSGSRPAGPAPDPGAASLAADDDLPAPAVERDAAASADATRLRWPSRMVLVTPDARAARSRHRWERDIAAPAVIRADEGLPPGVDVGGAHPVGHDAGPALLGNVLPAHMTEFRRNGVIRETRPRAHGLSRTSADSAQFWSYPTGSLALPAPRLGDFRASQHPRLSGLLVALLAPPVGASGGSLPRTSGTRWSAASSPGRTGCARDVSPDSASRGPRPSPRPSASPADARQTSVAPDGRASLGSGRRSPVAVVAAPLVRRWPAAGSIAQRSGVGTCRGADSRRGRTGGMSPRLESDSFPTQEQSYQVEGEGGVALPAAPSTGGT